MSTAANQDNAKELELTSAVFERIATDLALICDREFVVESATCERQAAKCPAPNTVHISFKLELRTSDKTIHGALIVPLADSIALASYLMMMSDETVASNRDLPTLDRTLKDAMVEIGNLIGGATDAVLRDQSGGSISARAEGCQGIRAGQNPAFPYSSGDPLIVARAKARLHSYPSFEMVLELPPIVLPDPH